ncbi:kinase-like domain-containing protein [Tribonema minus]|uniref:Kinase-like domain-containing protein n=1 Tax=Tribonema minus TaxID=303371 RepID=A0A835ZAG5_9STRA|nr:kinase-like domain-containing protein [Tribonema minus]
MGVLLGEGSFAKVRRACHKLTGQAVAIKTYERAKVTDPQQWKRIQQEVRLMERLNHPRVVRLFETVEGPKRTHLIMEACSGGNLCTYVKRRRRLEEAEARRLLDQILQAVEYLHVREIIHRDLKLENILLDEARNVKLVDFGFATSVAQGRRLHVFCGTPSYIAPEIIKRTDYAGKPVDIWSLGIVLYALLCGCFPFSGATYPDLYKHISRGAYRIPEWLGGGASDLISCMLVLDPVRRATLSQFGGLLIPFHDWLHRKEALFKYFPGPNSEGQQLVSVQNLSRAVIVSASNCCHTWLSTAFP